MFGSIIFIINADKKLIEINNQIEKIKTVDFQQLKKIVGILNKFNSYVKLDKIKQIFEITMTTISAINLIFLIKKLNAKKFN